MKINWPNMKDTRLESGVPLRIFDFNRGYNAGLKDAKRAVEEAIEKKLIPAKLINSILKTHRKWRKEAMRKEKENG